MGSEMCIRDSDSASHAVCTAQLPSRVFGVIYPVLGERKFHLLVLHLHRLLVLGHKEKVAVVPDHVAAQASDLLLEQVLLHRKMNLDSQTVDRKVVGSLSHQDQILPSWWSFLDYP